LRNFSTYQQHCWDCRRCPRCTAAPTDLEKENFSDNILPIQADFENEEGKATWTERDFIKKISLSSIVTKKNQDHVADN
jgi:hypothetical protein